MRWLISLISLFCLLATTTSQAATPAVAFYYGADAPFDEIKAFDIVVVDPDHAYDPNAFRKPYSELYAYVAIGEAHPDRAYFKDIPPDARLAENKDWHSLVIDLSHPHWPEFVAERIVAPLWKRGYRGFFLDTLDSYRLAGKFDEAAQQTGLVNVIETLHERFPGIQLIVNRGFEVVPRIKDKIRMVAAESLFRGWNATARRYAEVKTEDREWLLGQLIAVRDTYGIPVLAIDYVDPRDRDTTRATAQRIKALGILPWVADSALATLGIGQREVVPRKILMLYDGRETPAINESMIARFAAMPINHLGYIAEFHDINKPLPSGQLAGRYAGIVLWANDLAAKGTHFAPWLRKQVDSGLRLAVFGGFGVTLESGMARFFDLDSLPPPAPGNRLRSRTASRPLQFRPDPRQGRPRPIVPASNRPSRQAL